MCKVQQADGIITDSCYKYGPNLLAHIFLIGHVQCMKPTDYVFMISEWLIGFIYRHNKKDEKQVGQ